ncbi:MAG: redoxin domain-containing protein [Acidobacteria bacterium]|nr:redoxin domain-containing protein [Acidobacteriota bacterium]
MSSRTALLGRSARIRSIGLTLALVTLAAAPACQPGGSALEERLADGRAKFEEGFFHDAQAVFAAVLDDDPDNAAAAYAVARTAMVLHEYEEAIPAYERALALAPDDPRVHEEYVYSLGWGGTFRGRRDWFDQALEAAGEAVRRFPDLGPLYFEAENAADGLNDPDAWLQTLEEIEPDVGDSPVFRIHRAGARLEKARSGGDDDNVAVLENEIRAQLVEAAEAAEGVVSKPETGLLRYVLVHGYSLLDDREAKRMWLERLEEVASARHLAASYAHFDLFYEDYFGASGEPADVQLEILDRWLERFPPRWENEDFLTATVPLSLRVSLLVEESERRAGSGVAPVEGSPPDETTSRLASLTHDALLDEMIDLTERLARLDTGYALGTYGEAINHLLAVDERADEVLRLADQGIARIREGRSGLVYPGTRAEEFEATTDNWWAGFERARGRALRRLDRPVEAEEALRSAVARWKRADRLASLAEFLIEQERDTEGYGMLVDALAWHAADGGLRNEPSYREEALAAAGRLGKSEAELDADLATAAEGARVELRERLLGRPLDAESPDFELADTLGEDWRLSDLVGKTVVLNYWATWCGPCRAELPHYAELAESYASREDVVFLAITTDANQSVARDFLEEHGYEFTTLFDEGSATDFNITGIPATIVIGPEGRIQYRAGGFPGKERYEREMRWRIDELAAG